MDLLPYLDSLFTLAVSLDFDTVDRPDILERAVIREICHPRSGSEVKIAVLGECMTVLHEELLTRIIPLLDDSPVEWEFVSRFNAAYACFMEVSDFLVLCFGDMPTIIDHTVFGTIEEESLILFETLVVDRFFHKVMISILDGVSSGLMHRAVLPQFVVDDFVDLVTLLGRLEDCDRLELLIEWIEMLM